MKTLAGESQQSEGEIAWLPGKSKVPKQKDQCMKALKCRVCVQTHNFWYENRQAWGRRCNVCNDQNLFA